VLSFSISLDKHASDRLDRIAAALERLANVAEKLETVGMTPEEEAAFAARNDALADALQRAAAEKPINK